MDWHLVAAVIGIVGVFFGLIRLFLKPPAQKRLAAVALIFLFAFATYEGCTYVHDPLRKEKVYTEGGNFPVDGFLRIISQGTLQVSMDSRILSDLSQKHVIIKVQPLKGAPMKYVLDHVFIPQLPGPEQWSYDVVGTTVMVQRR